MSPTLKVILGIVIFLCTFIIDLYTDFNLWKENKPVNHKRGAILRLLGLIPANILIGLAAIPLLGSLYWFLFDGFYNVLRGFNWWFTGSNDVDDAKTDDFLQRLKPWQHQAIKIGAIILSLTFYLMVK